MYEERKIGPWTQQERNRLLELCGSYKSLALISDQMNRDPQTVRLRAKKLGFDLVDDLPPPFVRKQTRFGPYSEQEDRIIIKAYPKKSIDWIAMKLGRTEKAIAHHAAKLRRLGLMEPFDGWSGAERFDGSGPSKLREYWARNAVERAQKK